MRMDKRSHACFNDDILAEATRRYGIDPITLQLLGGFESFIYSYTRNGKDYILRLSHSLRYSYEMIAAELDWVDYLADHGIPAARGVPSLNGHLAEKIEASQGYFTVSAFEKAPGGPPRGEDWERGLLAHIGRLLGRMHALTKTYQPSDPNIRRPNWDIGMDSSAEEYLPPGEETVVAVWHALLADLRRLPQDRDSFGLVHVDVHGGNFFVEGGQITLFDFGDCQYAWFAYDLAMAFFYVLPHHCETPEQLEFARRAFCELMSGYTQENELAPAWLETIPLFLKLREIDLYIAIHRSLDLNNLDPWCASFMRDRKAKIEKGIPYANISYHLNP
jgi:Ser/Thr protein kinase RdoA (MazF antagonist)